MANEPTVSEPTRKEPIRESRKKPASRKIVAGHTDQVLRVNDQSVETIIKEIFERLGSGAYWTPPHRSKNKWGYLLVAANKELQDEGSPDAEDASNDDENEAALLAAMERIETKIAYELKEMEELLARIRRPVKY